MIDDALAAMADSLNRNLRHRVQDNEDLAVLSNLVDAAGALVPIVSNRLVLFLVGIEHDAYARRALGIPLNAKGALRSNDPVYLNLMVMCAANFSGRNYAEALKFLSAAIQFFQEHSVIDRATTPTLAPGIEKLVLNIENQSSTEMHSLWGLHGGRYLPSVLYRVRMISIEPGTIAGRRRSVEQIDVRPTRTSS